MTPSAPWRACLLPRLRALVGPGVAVATMAAVSAAAALLAHAVTMNAALHGLQESAQRRLETVAAELDGVLSRFEVLPALLETTPTVTDLLAAPANAALRERANLTLNRINAMAGADMVFVLDRAGNALAAADWDQPATPVGHNYAYRPYMKQALSQGRGRFFGVGATSGRPGYFLSYALHERGGLLGVATVKVDLEPAMRSWASRPGELLVADERGVVLLASRPAWVFKALQPLSEAQREVISAERSYNPQPGLLPWAAEPPAGDGAERVRIDGQLHLVTRREQPALRWQLMALDPLAPAEASARNAAWLAALAAAVSFLLLAAGWLSRRAAMQKLAAQAALKQANDTLEARVTERTQQLSLANATLAEEVEQRTAAETSLRETQQELVHAAKLAVLGQMSAGLAHELNQPLAALRTLSDNAVVLLDKERVADTRENLLRISMMVARLGETTRRLKTFAHKPGYEAVPTPLRSAVANARALLAERMRRLGVSFEPEIEPAELAVRADPSLLEQVLVNLLANAVDALAHAEVRRITLRAWRTGEHVHLDVSDTGSGIAPEIAPHLFEPFATSKPPGAGLGLGLMISRRIVQDFGGTLTAAANPQGGASFHIELPAVEVTVPQSADHAGR